MNLDIRSYICYGVVFSAGYEFTEVVYPEHVLLQYGAGTNRGVILAVGSTCIKTIQGQPLEQVYIPDLQITPRQRNALVGYLIQHKLQSYCGFPCWILAYNCEVI